MAWREQQHFREYVLERLQPHGPITSRAMFGGYGIYHERVMFALIAYGQLYFKVDETNRKDYAPYKSLPFTYEGAKKPVVMSYLMLPEEILEDPKKLPGWIQKSVQIALRAKLKNKKSPRVRQEKA